MYNTFRKIVYLKLVILIIFQLLITSNATQAQVTIGSSNEPISGALLDLKQETVTTKGLGMPRVALRSINELIMGDNAIPNTDSAYDKHIGLIVYNTTSNRIFCPGVYVWNGKQWDPLLSVRTPPDITVNDIDGNTYIGKWFTKDPCNPTVGKYWTTSNIYTTKSADGNSLPAAPATDTGFARLNPGYRNDPYSPTLNSAITINTRDDLETGTNITYKEGLSDTSLTSTTLSRLNFAKKFGLLYTQEQATKACPIGWHLPTDADWIDLLKALDEDGEISNNLPGANDAGQKMRASSHWYKSVDRDAVLWGQGDDANVIRSGFDAYPSGDVDAYVGGDGTTAVNFSSDTYWWSASKSAGGAPYVWNVALNDKTLYRIDWLISTYYFSVRCVKD